MRGRRVFGQWDPYLAPPFRDDPADPGNDPVWDFYERSPERQWCEDDYAPSYEEDGE